MQDLLVTLITFFLVEPLQHEIATTLADLQAPREVVTSLLTCASEHGSQIVDLALGDPWWAASSAFGVWVGLTEPFALLTDAVPDCAAAVEAARPFLDAQQETNG
jgi:hypothetical protein